MIKYRPYQTEILKRFKSLINSGETDGLLVLGTGGGKTLIAISAIKENFLDKGKRVLWVVHRNELLWQAVNTLNSVSPDTKFSVHNATEKHMDGQIVFMSVQSYDGLEYEFDCIVIDETHHECAYTYKSILSNIKYQFKFGLTACPIRLDEQVLDYTNIIDNISIMKLISLGYAPKLNIKFIKEYKTEPVKPKSIAFINNRNSDIIHALYNTSIFKKSIYIDATSCYNISNTTSIDRSKLWDEKPSVIVNKEIFIEGFDWPDCENVYIDRCVNSLNELCQMIGRAMRLSKGAADINESAKKEITIYINENFTSNEMITNLANILEDTIDFTKISNKIAALFNIKRKQNIISSITTAGKNKIINNNAYVLLKKEDDKYSIITTVDYMYKDLHPGFNHKDYMKGLLSYYLTNIEMNYSELSIVEDMFGITSFEFMELRKNLLNNTLYLYNKYDSNSVTQVQENAHKAFALYSEIPRYIDNAPNYKNIGEQSIAMLNDYVFSQEKQTLRFDHQNFYGKAWTFRHNTKYKNDIVKQQQYYKLRNSLAKKIRTITNRKHIDITIYNDNSDLILIT